MDSQPENHPVATLAGGCFWCVESELRRLGGVLYTRVGYTGGSTASPTYKQITTGKTGHAEAVEATYDPATISYEEIIHFFLTKAHDPTQLNRQGVDVGTQYRSAIYFHDDVQKETAARVIAQVDAENIYANEIVTELVPAQKFWLAEDYHQQYYEKYEEENGTIHPRVLFKRM
ncbi:MAG: peptide-methionine (S)-S-oxide reductase MsrA [Alphaproteobacteria bacterium]